MIVDWSTCLASLLNQSEVKLKPIMTCSRAFFSAYHMHLFYVWSTGLYISLARVITLIIVLVLPKLINYGFMLDYIYSYRMFFSIQFVIVDMKNFIR